MHLNLKNAKKIASDKDSSTFRHPDGHEFKVLHKPLSAAMRKEVSAIPMAEGGYVDTVTSGDPIVKAVKGKPAPGPDREGEGWTSKPTHSPKDPKDEDYKSQAAKFNAKMAPEQAMAEGGKVQKFAEGSQEPIQDLDYQQLPESASSQPPVTINIGQPEPAATPQGTPAPAAEAGQDASKSLKALALMAAGPIGSALASSQHPIPDSALQYGAGIRSGFTGEALPTVPATEQGPSPAGAPEPAAPPVATGSGAPSKASNPYQAAMQEQVKGLEMGEKAQEMAAKGKESALEDYNKAQNEAAHSYDANVKDAMNLRQQALEALQNTKVDPDRYWNNKSTGGQISSIIGILAAGFNPTHNPNAAIEMLNKSIDRDIESQKMDIGKKQNLLSAANDHFRNIQSAADFHRVLANDLVSHQIDLAAAKAATPAAQAELLKARGALKFDSEMRMAQVGAMQTLNGQASPSEQDKALNTLRLVAPEKAKEYEQRIIPGVGTSTVPVPEKKREAFAAAATFMGQMDALEKFRQAHKGTLVDRGVVDEGHRLAELARNSFRIAQGEGVFKEGSAKFNERLIPDPTDYDFFNKNKAAYQDMKSQANAEVQNSSKVYGIKPGSDSIFAEGANLSPQEKAYLDFARANPKDPRSPQILKKLGVK